MIWETFWHITWGNWTQQVGAIIYFILPVTISYVLIQGFSLEKANKTYLLDCKYELDRKPISNVGKMNALRSLNNVRSIEEK